MKKQSQPILVMCAALILSILSGCGQNIYKGLAGTATQSPSEALKAGHYDAAISGANTIITSGASGETLQTAYAVKGTAILMKYESLPYHLFQTIIDLSDQSNSNIITTFIARIPIDYQNAMLAADALNSANMLSSTTNITVSATIPLPPSLNSTAQLSRAIANTSVTIKLVTRYLEIGSDGSVTKNTAAIAEGLSMADIIEALTQPPKTLAYYAEAAVHAGSASRVFTDDQLVILNRISMMGQNLSQLRGIVDNGNSGTFTLVDETNTVVSGSPTLSISSVDPESAYTAAFEQIIRAMTTGSL